MPLFLCAGWEKKRVDFLERERKRERDRQRRKPERESVRERHRARGEERDGTGLNGAAQDTTAVGPGGGSGLKGSWVRDEEIILGTS
jgi:hypothetical protein